MMRADVMRVRVVGTAWSEIWLVCLRDMPDPAGFPRVVGTNKFWPLSEDAQWAPVRDACRPWCRKDAIILHGEVELQTLAPVVKVADKALVGHGKRNIVLFPPFFSGLRGFVIEQSIT